MSEINFYDNGSSNPAVTSFQVPKGIYPFVDPFVGDNEPVDEVKEPDSYSKLHFEVEKMVKKDGIDPKIILPYENKQEVIDRAVDTIVDDIVNFYAWYFSDDDRTIWLGDRAKDNLTVDGHPIPWHDQMPESLRKAVEPIVSGLLDEMRDIGDIPEGKDGPELEKIITDNLTKYSANWQAWFYDRKMLEDIDDYFEQADMYDDIYLDDKYGDLTNVLDENQFDRYTDVPYIAEP